MVNLTIIKSTPCYPANRQRPTRLSEEQVRIVAILDKFEALLNDILAGLSAEIAARRQQYEYYRNKLLTFKDAA